MTQKNLSWKDALISVLAGLTVGGALAGLDGNGLAAGWLAYGLISAIGFLLLTRLWRGAGGKRWLGTLMLLAFGLRIGIGVGLSLALPSAGTGSEVQQAGYLSIDAYNRDKQSWELAQSPRPIWDAFDKSYAIDQYGGMEALSALTYRYLSPDAQRPWLILLISALLSGLGIYCFWQAGRVVWDARLIKIAGWIFALYPENLFWGSSQMREPFLLAFIAMAWWGLVIWQVEHARRGWVWLVAGLIGLLSFSPGASLFAIFLITGWAWLRKGKHRFSWQVVLALSGVLFLGILLLWAALARGSLAGAPLLEGLPEWFRLSVKWDIYQLERDSGTIQNLFRNVLPEWLKLPFIYFYGLLQPILPAAIFEPSKPLWQWLGFFRSLGWYLLFPLLIYSVIAIFKSETGNRKAAWLWIWGLTWAWISISALRAGGDQWDNPRYRLILLMFQAALAAKTWLYYRETKDAWLPRLLLMEVFFLVIFGSWYAARYTHIVPMIPWKWMGVLIPGFSLVVIVVGIWLDRKRKRVGL